MSDLLAAALWHASEGRPVFPCAPRSKRPLTPHGFHDATRDEETIRAWWRSTPDANLALACESFVVFDVDHGVDKPGRESLAELIDEHGPLPPTWHATTPSGGEHFFFRMPERPIARAIGVRPGVDLLGLGGYVIVSPSVTEAGAYAFDDGGERLAACPEWVSKLARPVEPVAREERSGVRYLGRYGSDLERRIERAVAYVDRMPPAIAGQRGHDAMLAVAIVLIRGFALPPAAAREILLDYSARCSPPWSRREVEHKLASAIDAQRVGIGYLSEAKR